MIRLTQELSSGPLKRFEVILPALSVLVASILMTSKVGRKRKKLELVSARKEDNARLNGWNDNLDS